MNKQINEIIPLAIQELNNQDNNLLKCDKEGKIGIDKRINGYIASLGTAILQSGLFASIAFFDREQKDGEERLKNDLSKTMAKTMAKYFGKEIEKDYKLIDLLLKEYVENDEALTAKNLKKFQKDLLNLCVGYKLAVRTFYLYEE